MIKAAVTVLLASMLSTASLATPPSAHNQPSAATAHDAHEAHASSHHTAVAPPDSERWPTDEPLRTGMSRIQAAVDQAMREQTLSRERSVALASTIEQNVTYIIEHCKLPPQADAALHVLIGRMLTATHQLKSNGSSDAAVAQIVSALHDYREAFADSPAAPSEH